MVEISVIVPVYNAERFLKRCLDALVSQTFKNLEIIVIEDCSEDNTKIILDEFQNKYEGKVRIIYNQRNKGVSASRNEGILSAQGKYLVFCDADDWYEKDAVELMYNSITEHKADFLISNYYLNKDSQKMPRDIVSQYNVEVPSRKQIVKYMDLSSCGKMISRELLKNNNLLYPMDLKRCEEYQVIPVAAYLADKVVCLNRYTYHYYQNKGSASNKKEEDLSFFDISFDRYCSYIDKEKYKAEIEYRAREHLLYGKVLSMLKYGQTFAAIKQCINIFEKDYTDCYDKDVLRDYPLSRKVFFQFVKRRWMIGLKALAFIHTLSIS